MKKSAWFYLFATLCLAVPASVSAQQGLDDVASDIDGSSGNNNNAADE